MKTILQNEIYRLIKREPTEEELDSAIQYIEDSSDDLTDYSDIPQLLEDWLHDNMTKCAYCGSWHLFSEMENEHGNWYCDSTCVYEDENGLDMEEEARRDFEAKNR